MFDQPLQSVCDEVFASLRVLRPEFNGEALRPIAHLFRNGIVFSCIKLGDWHTKGHLEGKCRVQRGLAIAAFVLGDLSPALAPNQIRYLGLTQPRSFSVSPQVIVEFWKSHEERGDPLMTVTGVRI
jgi:hypothetical protein